MNPENLDGGQHPEDALSFFEEQLLDKWDYIGCGFDVHFTCSHEISVEWCSNSGNLSSETDEEDEDDDKAFYNIQQKRRKRRRILDNRRPGER